MANERIKSLSILDRDYLQWIKELSTRYRRSQVKASVKVNQIMLRFYWELGRDIVEKKAESRWGSRFMKNLSRDLKEVNPDATCFSETNLLYMKNFYRLYQPYIAPQAVKQITQQLAEQMDNINTPQPGEQFTQQAVEQKENTITPQLGEQIRNDIFSIGWGHHKVLIDKYSKQPEKALFFVHQTVENGWSRDMLLNFMGTDLYERQGKALTNFQRTLPEETSDLARELTSWRKGAIHRPVVLQSQSLLLCRHRGKDWKVRVCRYWSIGWLCGCLQSYTTQRRTRQSYDRSAYLQGERSCSGTICFGIK